MSNLKNAVKDISCIMIFLLSITAVFLLENFIYVFFISLFSILFVAFLTRNRRQTWPVLIIVFLLLTIEMIVGLSITHPVVFCFVFSLIDLFIAFSIVHFHRDAFLLRICGVRQYSPQVYQVFLISFVLAVSSFYSFLLGSEMLFVEMNPKFYDNSQPFFVSIYTPVKVTIKFLLDLIVWSLALETARWKFLSKIEQRLTN